MPSLITLSGNRVFTRSMLGAVIDLAGFTLNLASISGHGIFILRGPGAYTGLLSGNLAADEAQDFAVVGGDFRLSGVSGPGVGNSVPPLILAGIPVSGEAGTPGILGQLAVGYTAAFPEAFDITLSDQSAISIRVFKTDDPIPYFWDGDLTWVAFDIPSSRWRVEFRDIIYRSPVSNAGVHPTTLLFTQTSAGAAATPYPVMTRHPGAVYSCIQVSPPKWNLISNLQASELGYDSNETILNASNIRDAINELAVMSEGQLQFNAAQIAAISNAQSGAAADATAKVNAAFEEMQPLELTAPPVDATVDGSLGTAQVETLTVTSGATTTETLGFEIRYNGGTVITNYSVPVTAADNTPALVAAKIRAAVAMDTVFLARWDLSGTGANVVLTKRLPYSANDSLFRMRLYRFITLLNTSVDTTAGVLADGTHAKLGQTAIVTVGGISSVYVCVNEAYPKWILTTDTAASLRAKAAEAHALFRTAIHSVGSDATGIPGATQLNNVVVIPSADYNDIPVEDLDPQTAYILPDAEEIGTTAPLAGVAVGGGPLTDGAAAVVFPVLLDLGVGLGMTRSYGAGLLGDTVQYILSRDAFSGVWTLSYLVSVGVFRTWVGNSSGQATPDLVTSWTPTSPATGVPTIAFTAATVAPPYIRVAGGFLYVADAGFWKKAPLSALLGNPSLPRVFTITADYTIVNSDSGSSISVTSFARITLPPSPGVPVSFTLKATAAVSFVCSSSYAVVSEAGILTRVTGGTVTPFAVSQDGGGVIPRIFSCAFIGDQWVITTVS